MAKDSRQTEPMAKEETASGAAEERLSIGINRKALWSVLSPVLAILTVWALLRQSRTVSMTDILHTAAAANRGWFLSAAASAFLFILFEGAALCSIVRAIGHGRRPKDGLLYAAADVYFSAITPSATGGQPASAYFMLRDGIPEGVVTAALIFNLMMYTLSGMMLAVFGLILRPGAFDGFGTPSRWLIGLGGLAQMALLVFFWLILKKGHMVFSRLERLLGFLGRKGVLHRPEKYAKKLQKATADYGECARLFAENGRLLLKALGWNIAQRTSQMIVPALLYVSMGGGASNAVMLFSRQCLITVGYSLVPIPGAMGVADYLMLDGFSGLMGYQDAFALEMLSRGITFYICVAVSGLITLGGYLLKRYRRR